MSHHLYYGHLDRCMPRVIHAEASQEDDGGFFARLGGLAPDPDDDAPTAKGLFQHMSRSNDENRADCHTPWEDRYNKIPGHTGHGLTTAEYLELEKRRLEGMKLAANYIRKNTDENNGNHSSASAACGSKHRSKPGTGNAQNVTTT